MVEQHGDSLARGGGKAAAGITAAGLPSRRRWYRWTEADIVRAEGTFIG